MPRREPALSQPSALSPLPAGPTARAVADGVLCHREACELSRSELAYVLARLGHPLTVEAITAIEERRREVSVDDLMALAHALDTTPVMLLGHVPLDMPDAGEPIATGVPADTEILELRSWMTGATSLDDEGRRAFWRDHLSRLEVRHAHASEQLEAVEHALSEQGDEMPAADALYDVDSLEDQALCGQEELTQLELATIYAEQHLENLGG